MMERTPSGSQQQKPWETAGGPGTGRGWFWLGLVGAAVGGVVSYFVFHWFLRRGIVLLALPGALVGLGRFVVVRRKSWLLAGICMAVGLSLTLYIADNVVVGGIGSLRPFAIFVIVTGGLIAFWFGLGRSAKGGDGGQPR